MIESMREKEVSNGGSYVLVRLAGQDDGLFDWDGHLAAAGLQEGDEVVIQHGGGKYPRVRSARKLGGADGDGKASGRSGETTKHNGREVQIARMCALKAAACLLQQSELEHQERASEVIVLAERLEHWVLR